VRRTGGERRVSHVYYLYGEKKGEDKIDLNENCKRSPVCKEKTRGGQRGNNCRERIRGDKVLYPPPGATVQTAIPSRGEEKIRYTRTWSKSRR